MRIESSALAANVVESVSVGDQFSSCAGEYDGVDTLEVQAEYLLKGSSVLMWSFSAKTGTRGIIVVLTFSAF